MDNRKIACLFGDRIRRARQAREMSVAELAEAVGVTRAAVYKWESGEAIPSPEVQLRIAKALSQPHVALFHIEAA